MSWMVPEVTRLIGSLNRFWNQLLFWQDCIWICFEMRGLIPLKTRGFLIESTISSYFVGASLILRHVHFNSETLEIWMPGPYKTRTCLARFKWGLQLCEVTILEKTFLLFRMSTPFFKSTGKCFCVNIDSKVGSDMNVRHTFWLYSLL